MGASTTQGTGTASAEGPLRGYDLDNIRRVYINQSGTLLPCIYIIGSGGGEKYVLRAVSDGQVKVDSDDVPDYLGEKLVAGTNVTLITSAGPNKTITINAATDGDEKVKVDVADSTAGYLDGKLVAGANITLTPSVGPNKTLTIASTGGGTDELVKIDAADSTAGYLDVKLLAGSNITLTVSAGPNKDMTISASGNPVVVDIGAADPDFDEAVLSITAVIKGTVSANFTMTNLTITDGVTDKMQLRVELTQAGGGGDISSWSANFIGSDLIPLTSVGLSIGAGKTDILVLEWDADRAQWMLVGFINGILP